MKENINNLKENISNQKKISQEIKSLYEQLKKVKTSEEKNMIDSQIKALEKKLSNINKGNINLLEKSNMAKPLKKPQQKAPYSSSPTQNKQSSKDVKDLSKLKRISKEEKILGDLEKHTLSRLKKKEKKVVQKKKPKLNPYVQMANTMFSSYSRSALKKGKFKSVEKGIIKAKLNLIPASYISVLILSSIVSVFVSFIIYLFFLFFSVQAGFPMIVPAEGSIALRALKLIWIIFFFPAGTFLMMYLYPSLEEKSSEMKINQELPFATINMAAISGSMIDPSRIFEILISTDEYPYLKKEFTRLLNQINIYGYDLITAMKNVATNSPSKKLAELLNGLATTISSGGDLPNFFEKRAESLLFDYKIEMEKYTKSAETFMDIYISVVIAAPMILMLLLIMMKISGLGLSLSTGAITLMTVMGVFLINIIFLTFLHLKQPVE